MPQSLNDNREPSTPKNELSQDNPSIQTGPTDESGVQS